SVQGIGVALELDPAFSRGRLYSKLMIQCLEIARIVIIELLRHARVFEVQSFSSHGAAHYGSFARAARSCAASSLSACGTTVVLANTGMKFVSPSQRGTT